jgi:single-strand DNA-binding protein
MKDLNKVQLIGRLGADPELSYSEEGTARCTFRVAVNRTWKDADGQPQEDTEWIGVVAWQRVAEIAGEYLKKGSRVYIEGRLKTTTWEDDSGQRQYRTEVVLDELIMLDPPPRRDDGDDDGGTVGAQTPPTEPDPAPPAPPTRRRKMSKAELAAKAADVL